MISAPIKPRRFVALSLLAIALLLPAYFLTIDLWLAPLNEKMPGSYKELLLMKTAGRRIFIDSGSNSFFGIDALMLARHFHRPVINLADNGGYPLRHKFHYLARHARQGDIILLPLEWPQYTYSTIYDNYVEPVLDGKLSYYYDALPLEERLRFVYEGVRVNLFLDAVAKRISRPHNASWAVEELEKYARRLDENHANSFGSGLKDASTAPPKVITGKSSCDKYLFTEQLKHGFVLSDEFKQDTGLLKTAVANGARVIFTWPIVVDYTETDRCYATPVATKNLKSFSTTIRDFIEAQGFLFMGSPQQNHYPNQYYYDTYYHLNETGAGIRTRRLIQQLEAAGVTPDAREDLPAATLQQLKALVNTLHAEYQAKP